MKVLELKNGIDRYDALYALTLEYSEFDNQKALSIINEAQPLAFISGDSLKIVRSIRIKGQLLRRNGLIDESINFFYRALPIAKRQKYNKECMHILSGLAISYTYQGEYDKALRFNFESLALRKKEGSKSGIASVLNNIGLIYYKLKDYRKGLLYFQKSLEFKRARKDNYHQDFILINMGHCYAYLQEFTKAKQYIEEGLKMCGNNCSEEVQVEADFAMGVVYFGLKQTARAEHHFLKSYVSAKEINDTRFQFDNIDYLSQIYIQQNRLEKAKHFLKEAEALIKKGASYNLELIKIYSRFFQMYSKTKNYKQTAFYQQKYIQLKDSIYDETLTTNLMKVEADYLERENKARIEAQEQVLVLNKEIINRQRILNIVTGFLVLILIAFAIMVWKNYVRKKKANVILDEKIRERTTELELSRDVLLKACQQRDLLIARASRDIKTTLSTMQGLCALGLKDISDPAARQYICEMDKTSSDLSDSLRSLFQGKEIVSFDYI